MVSDSLEPSECTLFSHIPRWPNGKRISGFGVQQASLSLLQHNDLLGFQDRKDSTDTFYCIYMKLCDFLKHLEAGWTEKWSQEKKKWSLSELDKEGH